MSNLKYIRIASYIVVVAIFMLSLRSVFMSPPKLIVSNESPHNYENTISNIKKAVSSNNFRIIREQRQDNKYSIYFCNFSIAYKAIKADQRIGFALPCRIHVFRTRGKVIVTTINTKNIHHYTSINIGALCKNIMNSIDAILEEALI